MITILSIIYFAYNFWSTSLVLEFLTEEGIQGIAMKHILFSLTCLPAVLFVSIVAIIIMIWDSAIFENGLLYKILNYKPFKRK